MLLWKGVSKYLFEIPLSIILGIHPEVELLDQMVKRDLPYLPWESFKSKMYILSISVIHTIPVIIPVPGLSQVLRK